MPKLKFNLPFSPGMTITLQYAQETIAQATKTTRSKMNCAGGV